MISISATVEEGGRMERGHGEAWEVSSIEMISKLPDTVTLNK